MFNQFVHIDICQLNSKLCFKHYDCNKNIRNVHYTDNNRPITIPWELLIVKNLFLVAHIASDSNINHNHVNFKSSYTDNDTVWRKKL